MDERVKNAQVWLNKKYQGKTGFKTISVTGRTGNVVMQALVTALQIELGIENPTGYFGKATENLYNKNPIKKGDEDKDKSIIRILQHGLYCKGYNPTAVTGYFGENTLKAVHKVLVDAGFDENDLSDTLSAKAFKAILSSDALTLVSGGEEMLRKIQQNLNRKYSDLTGIISCDGKYNAATNEALIYAFQIESGMDRAIANGNFGPATTKLAGEKQLETGNARGELVKIAKYALYCNGVRRNNVNRFDCSENGEFSDVFDSKMKDNVENFQRYVGILEVDGKVDIKVWMSLLVSTGYPKRNVLACDTSTRVTSTKAKRIYANDFRIIGRYLTGSTLAGPKNLTKEELETLFNQGLSVFAIYQDEKEYYRTHPDEETTVNYYNYNQGFEDAKKAVKAASDLGIPYGEPIFFAVDYDFNNDQTTDMIIPHFQGIIEYIRQNGNKYLVGCYGPRNICKRISDNGYATYSFVSDMSTGFSGNKGFILPENWAFDQIREYTQGSADGSFALDCVATSGKYMGFKNIVANESSQKTLSSKDIALNFSKDTTKALGYDIDIKSFDETYTIDLPELTISCETTYGHKVSVGSGNRRSSLTVKDGKIVNATYDEVMNKLKDASSDNSVNIDYNGIVDLQNKLQFNVKNGYIEYGLNISETGEVSISYLIHKDANVSEGLTEYVEVGLKITFKEHMPLEDVKKYYENKRKARELNKEAQYEMMSDIVSVGLVFTNEILRATKNAVEGAAKIGIIVLIVYGLYKIVFTLVLI